MSFFLREKPLRLLILLSAAVLRLWALTDVPPGLTHDEGDHGLTAWEILQGNWSIYFSVGYGREPLYDYVTALFMGLTRPSFLIGRLTAVFFSLLLMAAVYAMVKRFGSTRIALLTLAGLAVGFWPLMAARQALRSITLPVFLVLAVYFWLRSDQKHQVGWTERTELTEVRPHDLAEPSTGDSGTWRTQRAVVDPHDLAEPSRAVSGTVRTQHAASFLTGPTLLAGLFLGLSFYTYLASRVMWLILPGMLLYWVFANRERYQNMWRPTLAALLIAGALSTPLWLYLWQNPGAEQRVGQLTQTLESAGDGNLLPLATTMMEGVRLIPFQGDTAWRYNIPDRPLLAPFMAVLWFVGLVLMLARIFGRRTFGPDDGPIWKAAISKEISALFVGWLLLGLVPVFVTGRFLANTQVIGLMPVLYVFPAVALDWMLGLSDTRSPFVRSALVLLFLAVGMEAAQSYFFTWGQAPEVQIQYETPLIHLLEEINETESGVYAISNPTPGPFHSQPLGLVTLHNSASSLRWFNGLNALYITQGDSQLAFPADFALPPQLENLIPPDSPRQPWPLNPDLASDDTILVDINSTEWTSLAESQFAATTDPTSFGNFVDARGIIVSPLGAPEPGSTVDVLTWWTINQPSEVELVLFTQLIGLDGQVAVQMDRLDAPANAWVKNDHFVQLHQLALPADLPDGRYRLISGFYNPADNTRLPVLINGESVGLDFWEWGTIEILNP